MLLILNYLNLLKKNDEIISFNIDILTDKELVEILLRDFKPKVIMNLAAKHT